MSWLRAWWNRNKGMAPADEEGDWPWMVFDIQTGNALDAAPTKAEAEAKAHAIREDTEGDPDDIVVIGP